MKYFLIDLLKRIISLGGVRLEIFARNLYHKFLRGEIFPKKPSELETDEQETLQLISILTNGSSSNEAPVLAQFWRPKSIPQNVRYGSLSKIDPVQAFKIKTILIAQSENE